MPLTVPLNLQSIAYPSISNRIRVDVATQLDPSVIVVSEIDAIAGHPARIWSFPGLPRTNYVVTMNEIDGSGNPINNLAFFDVVPTGVSGAFVRDDEQIKVGVTPGLIAGNTHITFDGTGGKPDYRGWNINPERRNAPGTMIRDEEYTWNPLTGDFDLITTGDVFLAAEPFNIDFDPIEVVVTDSPSVSAFTARLVTADDDILLSDFGNKIIAEPAAQYLKLTMPPIATIVANLPVSIECSSVDDCCVEIFTSDTMNFGYGKVFLCRGENIKIYKFLRSVGVYEFRADVYSDSILLVGRIIYSDATSVVGGVALDGRTGNILQYARLVDHLSRFPLGQQVAFADWSTDKTRFSTVSGDQFKFADRRGYYARPTTIEQAGLFWRCSIEKHKHVTPFNARTTPPFGALGFTDREGSGAEDNDNDWWLTNDGGNYTGAPNPVVNDAGVIDIETKPNSYSINQFILI